MLRLTPELKEYLEANGFYNLKEIEGRGICGLSGFIFTVGLVYGINKYGYRGRWCYPREKAMDAVMALEVWDGVGDLKAIG